MTIPEDILITRIVDKTASASDWAAFEELAQRDARAFERLHLAMQDDLLLRTAVEPQLAVADLIELPAAPRHASLARLLAPAGWLAALVLALLWVGSSTRLFDLDRLDRSTDGAPGQQKDASGATAALHGAGVMTRQNGSLTVPNHGLAGEKDRRSVLEELSPDVLELTPRGDGRVEVVYLKRTIERTIVDEAYGLVEDELGNARPALLRPARFARPRGF